MSWKTDSQDECDTLYLVAPLPLVSLDEAGASGDFISGGFGLHSLGLAEQSLKCALGSK